MPRFTGLRRSVTVLAAPLLVVISVAALDAMEPGGPAREFDRAQDETLQYLPSLQCPSDATGSWFEPRPSGMVGFGDSSIELQNRLDGADNHVEVRLEQDFEDDVLLSRRLTPCGCERVRLMAEQTVGLGRYSAIISGDGALGIVARTEWEGGAATAYEAPSAARELILPLMVRNIYSHTTIFVIKNTDDSDKRNHVHIEIFDNDSSENLLDLTARMPGHAVYTYDTLVEEHIFRWLPNNAADGFIGTVRFTADEPVAVMAYGDEMTGDGTSAYVARPIAAASRDQYLPSVRANYLGDSLIAIANPSHAEAVAVTITYRGHESSGGAGAGERFSQSFQIARRGAGFVDLAERSRGTKPSPGLPRGTRRNEGFFGSATIRASGPVLAAVQNEARTGSVVHAVAAYNAFGPDDLGTAFTVPRAFGATGGRETQLVLMNPGIDQANVVITFRDDNRQHVGSMEFSVPPESSSLMHTGDHTPRLRIMEIASSQPLAVLVNDTTLIEARDWGRWGTDTMAYPAVRMGETVPTQPSPTATSTASPTATPDLRLPTLTPTPISGETQTPSSTPTVTPGDWIYLPWLARGATR